MNRLPFGTESASETDSYKYRRQGWRGYCDDCGWRGPIWPRGVGVDMSARLRAEDDLDAHLAEVSARGLSQ